MKQILALAGVVTMWAAGLAAEPEADPSKGGRGVYRETILKEDVGLTDDQVEEVRKLKAGAARSAVRRRAELRIARMGLQELLDAPRLDEKAIETTLAQVASLRAAGERARVEQRLALRKLVSPEQYQKLRALQREHRALRRERIERKHRRHRSRGAEASEGDQDGMVRGDEA